MGKLHMCHTFPCALTFGWYKTGDAGWSRLPRRVQPIIAILIPCSFYTNTYIHFMYKFHEMKPSFYMVLLES